MKIVVRFAILISVLLSACGPANAPLGSSIDPTAINTSSTLIVFAAASLTDAFTEMGRAFESAHTGVSVSINFAGSQTLSVQLVEGAAADVFASANHTEMDKVVAGGLIEAGTPGGFPDQPAGYHPTPEQSR